MSRDPILGTEIGSYRIQDIIGRGGMGTVYLASHPQIKKQVVFKILKTEYSEKEDILQRFFQEARAVNQIRHENIIDISDCGKTASGLYYIQMEYLEGEPLQNLLKCEGPLSIGRLAHIGLQICSALSAAHERGIIHRDLKSDNIFLIEHAGKKDFVKLLDFGIAKVMEEHDSSKSSTAVGSVLGTPLYMSPEQAMGQVVDFRSDIYSLGVLLYQMATNAYPFSHKSPFAVASMHIWANVQKPSVHKPDLPAALEAVILRCLEKDKDKRYHSVYELALDLGAACGVDPAPYFFREGQSKLRDTLTRSSLSLKAVTLPTPLPSKTPKRYTTLAAVASAVLLLVGVLGLILLLNQSHPSQTPAAQLPPTPISVPIAVPVVASQPTSTSLPAKETDEAPAPTPKNNPKKNKPKDVKAPFDPKHHTVDPFKNKN